MANSDPISRPDEGERRYRPGPTAGRVDFPVDLNDFPVDPASVERDLEAALRAVIIHQAEAWPAGPLCRNDRDPHPCRIRRWGERVLRAAGRSDADIAELERRAAAGDLPWA